MLKKFPTLADAAIRESLRNHEPKFVPTRVGQKIAAARKFVLDDDASRFLSDLAHASYSVGHDKALAAIEHTRTLAKLPHHLTWIEYSPRKFRERTIEAYSETSYHVVPEQTLDGKTVAVRQKPAEGKEICSHMGWLLEEIGNTFVLTMVVGNEPSPEKSYSPRASALVMPSAFAWTSDDTVPMVAKSTPASNPADSRIATGIHGYEVPQVVIGVVPEMRHIPPDAATRALVEWMGELRYVWALLAAVNDIPVGIKEVKPTRGFLARGKIRKFVEHKVISILIPKKRDPQTFARQVVEISRRPRHTVRGHFRRDWRHEGNKIWIREHERGDASLGYVLHDYSIKHEEVVEQAS